MHESPKAVFFDTIASTLLIAVLGLSPLFFIPYLGFGVLVGKSYFIALGVLIVFVTWIIARLVQGVLTIPKTPVLLAGLFLPVAFLISAFFSPAWKVSLSGLFLGSGTVVGITILVLIFAGSVFYINSEQKITLLVKVAAIVTAVITVFQLAYLLAGPGLLSVGTFYTSVSNVVGKWNDLALWYAVVVLGVMVAFQFFPLARRSKIIALVLGIFSFLFLAIINFTMLWAVIGFVALVVFVYSLLVFRAGNEELGYRFPTAPFIILVLSLFFFLANPIIGTFVGQTFGVAQTEVRPSIIATGHVLGQTMLHHPIVGVGPERFSNAWFLYQPSSIIQSGFWNVSFPAGSGFIPTVLVTTGIIGGLALIAFLLLFILGGAFQVLKGSSDRRTHAYLVSSFVIAIFSWIIAFLYNPGVVALAVAFASSGAFFGILNTSGRIPNRQIHFLKDPRHSFFAIMLLVLFLLGSVFVLFTGAEKFASLVLYSRSQIATKNNNYESAVTLIAKADALSPSDVYERAQSGLAIVGLNKLFSDQSLSKDIVKSEFQNIFLSGEASAGKAVAYDKTNPDNWTNLASLYQNVIPLQIPGAYDNAKVALKKASDLAPFNPDIELLKAKLEIANKNNSGAKEIIQAALVKKPNFLDGIFLLAEIEAAAGDSATAIAQLEQLASSDSRNAVVFFKLGVFKYDAGDYAGAVSALERSVTLDRTVLNTYYVLGLAYFKVGNVESAKNIFNSIQKALPENETIAKIVANLNAGRAPLDGMQTDISPIPEETPASKDAPKKAGEITTQKPKTK